MTIIFLDKSVGSTCTLLSPLQETLLSYMYMTKLLVLGIIYSFNLTLTFLWYCNFV